MHNQIFELGAAPMSEPSAGINMDTFTELNGLECQVYRDFLLRNLGPEPPGCYFTIRSFPHDYGVHREVVLAVHDPSSEVEDYLSDAERISQTSTWDEHSLRLFLRMAKRRAIYDGDPGGCADPKHELNKIYEQHKM